MFPLENVSPIEGRWEGVGLSMAVLRAADQNEKDANDEVWGDVRAHCGVNEGKREKRDGR